MRAILILFFGVFLHFANGRKYYHQQQSSLPSIIQVMPNQIGAAFGHGLGTGTGTGLVPSYLQHVQNNGTHCNVLRKKYDKMFSSLKRESLNLRNSYNWLRKIVNQLKRKPNARCCPSK